jgi:hypothetical protein
MCYILYKKQQLEVEVNSTTVLWHIVQQELAKHDTVVLCVSYSPHIAPSDIILFAQLKTAVLSLF